METKLKVENPDTVKLTLAVTLSLREWKMLREQINHETTYPYPKCDFVSAIYELTNKAETYFAPDVKSEE
jgi:hypothetical protein